MASCLFSNKQKKIDKELNHYSFGALAGIKWEDNSHLSSFACRIDGVPKTQTRNFATTKTSNNKVRLWDPSQHHKKSFKKAFQKALSNVPIQKLFSNEKDDEPLPVKVTIKFFFSRPQKHYVWDFAKFALVLPENPPFFVTKAPDLDNMEKLVLDAIQGVCYSNDCHVSHIESSKQWIPGQKTYHSGQSDEGYTLIKITQYKNQEKKPGCLCLCCKAATST